MKRFFFVFFTLVIAVMSWEGQLTSANVLDNGPIPQESIRLRIIANSDSVNDQWLKREVRDAVVAQMNTWVKDIHSYDEARQFVAAQLPQLQELVAETIKARGFSYSAVVDFGQVPFPTKLYGSYVYPAGNYEALRIRIGEAKGQNWWCVLFPPLCFIDMSNGDAVSTLKSGQAQPDKAFTVSKETEESVDNVSIAQKSVSEQSELDQLRGEKSGLVRNQSRTWRSASEPGEQQHEQVIGDDPEAQRTAPIQKQAVQAVSDTTPRVEIRFFLWEKLAALF